MLKKLFFAAFLFISVLAQAQVLPPEIKCVQNDTIKWNLPVNNCGAFVSYLVYGSKSYKGPYVLLATVTSQSQKSYYHQHQPGESWFYFLQSKFNCPGIPVVSSDTLNGAAPELPVIESVSVEKGAVEVQWSPSASKNVTGYIIYKQTGLGIKPYDTLANVTTFIDKNVMPAKQKETYYVLALDRCNNTSLFEKSHSTIQATTKQDQCEREAGISWNRYKTWDKGILRHEVWVKQGGGNYALADTVAAKDTFFLYKNLKNNEKYCFYVRSIQKQNPKYASKTNEVCLTGDVVTPTDFILVKNLNIDAKGEVSFTWIWNNDADLDSIKIKKSIDGKTFKDITSLPTKPLNGEVSFTDKGYVATSDPIYYGIYSLDKCDNFVLAPFNTLAIKGTAAANGVNNVKWTDHFVVGMKDVEYELYRVTNGLESQIWTATNKKEFNDLFDPTVNENANLCYYVVAYAWDTLQNGKAVKVRSRSNTVCVSQTSDIFAPNAFAPRGVNQEFRPVLSFTQQIKEYLMEIYDRNGTKVFESTNFDDGWNGKVSGNGSDAPSGVYVYNFRILQTTGVETKKKGTVLLIR